MQFQILPRPISSMVLQHQNGLCYICFHPKIVSQSQNDDEGTIYSACSHNAAEINLQSCRLWTCIIVYKGESYDLEMICDMTLRFACSHNMRVIHDDVSCIRCDSMTSEWFAA